MKDIMGGTASGRILVVDDTSANLQLLANLLRGHGYTVHPASEGELALEFVQKTLPDLILLDIRMPGLDGYEVCRRLKADERTRAVPVIFISILEDERDKVLGFQAGAVDFITKPFQPEEVLARIQTHLRLREMAERLEQKVAERTGELTLANQLLLRETAERRRAEETLQRLNRELRAISSCHQALLKAEDEQTLLAGICRIICDEAGYCLAWVGYAEHDQEKTIRPVAWAGHDSDYVAEARTSWSEASERGQGPAGLAIRGGEPVPVQDFASESRLAPWRDAALARGYRSAISLPLKDEHGKVFGVLLVYSTEPYAVTAEEFKLLEELSGDLAFGITVLRAHAGLKRAEQVAQARLRILETAYTADIPLDDMLRRMLDEIEAQTGSHIAFYHFMEEDQQTLSLQNWSTNTLATMCTAEGKGRHYPVAAAGVWADCVREQRPVIHNSYASLPHRRGLPAGHAEVIRELVVPIFRDSRIVAIIGVGNKAGEYTETDVQIAELLGDFSWEIVIRKRAEKEVNLLNTALDHVQEGAFLVDLDGKFLYVNQEACRSLEYARDELIGMSVPDIDPDFPTAKMNGDIEDFFKDGAVTFETRHRARSGRVFPVEISSSLIAYGGSKYTLALARDISARKRLEQTLRESEEKFRTLAENSPDNVARYDVNCRIFYINPTLEKTLGRPASELLGATPMEASCTDENRAYQEKIAGVLATGVETEMDLTMPDRGEGARYHNVRFVAERGADGAITGVLAIGRDITERKLVEEELHRLKDDLEMRVQERTAQLEKNNAELERINRLFVGRELRMVELKQRIKKLEKG